MGFVGLWEAKKRRKIDFSVAVFPTLRNFPAPERVRVTTTAEMSLLWEEEASWRFPESSRLAQRRC
jgi:hypothetical protein